MSPTSDTLGPRHGTACPRRILPLGVRASLGFALVAIALAILSLAMLGERLLWEGGQQAYHTHFPFGAIWVLCGWGSLCATGSLVRRDARTAAVAALVVNLVIAGFFVRSYVRTSRDVQPTADSTLG